MERNLNRQEKCKLPNLRKWLTLPQRSFYDCDIVCPCKLLGESQYDRQSFLVEAAIKISATAVTIPPKGFRITIITPATCYHLSLLPISIAMIH